MSTKGRFLLQARVVLQAMIGGADLEKVRRHWPEHDIAVEDDAFVFRLKPKDVLVSAPAVPPVAPAGKAPVDDLALAAAAAAAAAGVADGSANPLTPVE